MKTGGVVLSPTAGDARGSLPASVPMLARRASPVHAASSRRSVVAGDALFACMNLIVRGDPRASPAVGRWNRFRQRRDWFFDPAGATTTRAFSRLLRLDEAGDTLLA